MALTDFASDLGQLVARQKPGTAMTPEMKALYAQRKWQNMHYAEYFWYIVLAVIGILAVVNVMDKGYNSWRKYRTLRQRLYDNQLPHGELRPVRNGEGGVRASRIPLAIGNWLRIACYRWTFPFTDATLADAFINLAYIALMLLWSFVACKFSFGAPRLPLSGDPDRALRLYSPQLQHEAVGESHWCHCILAGAPSACPRSKEQHHHSGDWHLAREGVLLTLRIGA